MSDTPRTDAKRGFHDLDTAVDAEFSEQLECELNAAHESLLYAKGIHIRKQIALDKANERIKRLEEVGDEMARWLSSSRNLGDDPFLSHKWYKAKEAKL